MRAYGATWRLAALVFCALAPLAAVAQQPADPNLCQVRVSTDPPGAVVSCDRVMRDASPVLIPDLRPGPHLVIAEKSGFRPARRTIILKPGQRMAVELVLEPLRGLLLIHSDPPGASVTLAGADRGKTPLLITDIPLGTHRVRLATDGYLPKEVDVTLPDRTPVDLNVSLVSDSAMLDLETDPPGAAVTVNGIPTGKTTPCRVDRIPAGPVTIELLLAGYSRYEQELTISPGRAEAMAVTMTPLPATLTVVSMPEGARIYVENQFRGTSPVTVDGLTPGDYRVRAELPGHAPLARTVALTRGETLREEFRLQSNSGTVRLTTEPAGVTVLIDGKERGVTVARPDAPDSVSDPLVIDFVMAGARTVLLTKKGYYDKVATLTVEADATVSLHEPLRRRFIPDCEVTTATSVHRGVLLEVDPLGNVRLETMPGVIKTIRAEDVRTRRPLRVEDVDSAQ